MIESKALNKLNKDLNEIGEGLVNASIEIPNKIVDRLISGAEDIRGTMIKEIAQGKKTGGIYLWEAAEEGDENIIGFVKGGTGKAFPVKKRDKPHQASAPGEAPATDHGELLRSIAIDQRDMEIEVGVDAGAPYAEWLEEGTAFMEARPFLEPAVIKHEKEIVDDIGEGVFEIVKKPFEGKPK